LARETDGAGAETPGGNLLAIGSHKVRTCGTALSWNAAGLKWTHPYRQNFANLEGKLSFLQVRKTWLWLILV
jgi:hypothetical protein